MNPPAIGIDLGTTNSVIAWIDESGRPSVIRNADGDAVTASVVAFTEDPPLVGAAAKEMMAIAVNDVAAFFKRAMGDPNFAFHAQGRDWSPTELSSLVLKKLRHDAEETLNRPVTHAVVTVPAYFNNLQRQATLDAGKLAGIDVLQIINEPTAAALAYGLDDKGRNGIFLVYDLGGGTFDVTLVEIGDDDFVVVATDGDHQLGGKDWDDQIAIWAAHGFEQEFGMDPLDDEVAFGDLLIRAEQVKQSLSLREHAVLRFEHGGHRYRQELGRPQFEHLTRGLMERTERLCERVLLDAQPNRTWADLGGVLLVGGSSRMPMVHEYVRKMSEKPPLTGVNLDEAVALGAAICAQRRLQERVPTVPRFGLGPRRTVRDVMSHSLGMVAEAADGTRYINSILIKKNQPIPCVQTRPYQLATRPGDDNELEVFLTQGESDVPTDCTLLGKYHFRQVPHGAGGVQVLDVSYRYDENGVVHVAAKERVTGRELPLTVEPLPEDMSWLGQPPVKQTCGTITAYLCVDLSGSMSGHPLREAKDAAREFLRQSDLTKCSIGLIEFADLTHTALAHSQNTKEIERAIDELQVGHRVGMANHASPFAHTQALLAAQTGPRFIIVLTDGVWYRQELAIQEARECHRQGIEIIAVGFGHADRRFLEAIATSDSGSYFASLNELVATFGAIAREITETAGGLARGEAKQGLRFLRS